MRTLRAASVALALAFAFATTTTTLARALREPAPRASAAATLAQQGEAAELHGHFADALRFARAARAMHGALGDRGSQISDLVDIGVAEEDLGRYADALRDQDSALSAARVLGRRLDAANALGNIGIVDMRMGHDDRALAAGRASLALDVAIHNRRGEGDERGRIAILEERAGAYAQALDGLAAALAIHRAIHNVRGEAKTLNNMGIVNEHLGRYAAALQAHEAALPLFRAVGDRLETAEDLDNIGVVDEDFGRYLPALAAHGDALAIFEAVGNRLGEANDLANTAIVDNDLGRYDESLHVLDGALVLDRGLGNALGEADALGSVGIVYEDVGRYEAALAQFQKALALHRAAKNVRGEASDLGNIGIVLGNLRRLSDAVGAEGDAYDLDRARNDASGMAADRNNVGNLEDRAGHSDAALREHERALAIDRTTGNRLALADVLSNVGNEDNELGRPADALAAAREALRLEGELGAPESLWRAQRVAARADAALGRRDAAIAAYDTTIGGIEALRASLDDVAERRSYFEDKLFVYDEYVDYLRDLDARYPGAGYDRRAFDVFEREQGRAFLEEIGQSSARRFSKVPPAITSSETDIGRSIDRVNADIAKARATEPIDAPAVAAQESERARLERARGALEGLIEARYPAYYALTHPKPDDPSAVQRMLAPGEVVLAYGVLDRATALWVIDRSHVRMLTLPGGSNAVAAKVDAALAGTKALERALALGETNRGALRRLAAGTQAQVSADAFALYEWLVPEAARGAVESASELIVVPTGPLYDLPWETLVTRDPTLTADPHYLIEDRAVSYLSSASLLSVLRSAEAARPAPPYSIVAFANPTFGQQADVDTGRGASARPLTAVQANLLAAYIATGPVAVFPDLKGTDVEAKAVLSALAPSADTHPLYEGEDASRETILRLQNADCAKAACLEDYRYVLFATHAVLPDQVEGLLQPALVLAHPERGGGFLTMGDVLGLSLDADVVSLSACNTGRGIASHGDGVRGLTQAFMFAGTPVVSVTLWELSDLAAAQLTPAFYAGIKSGEAPAEALREAKLALLHGDDALLRFPYFWAPTVIFGDGATALAAKT